MGLSSPAETAEVIQWAKQYPEVAAEINAIQAGLEKYAGAQAVTPDASVKQKIFDRIKKVPVAASVADIKPGTHSQAKIRSISPVWKTVAAACIILLIGSAIFNYTFYNKYQESNTQLATTQFELQQQKDMANAMNKEMGVMADKDAVPVSLAAMPDVADAAARM